MSTQKIKSVRKFLRCLDATDTGPLRLEMLSTNIEYDWLAAQAVPVKRSLVGRAEVESYLSILPHTYQILEADERIISTVGEKVLALGGERARLLRTEQVISAEWNAVFDFSDDLISRIVVSVYRWTILSHLQTQILRYCDYSDCSRRFCTAQTITHTLCDGLQLHGGGAGQDR